MQASTRAAVPAKAAFKAAAFRTIGIIGALGALALFPSAAEAKSYEAIKGESSLTYVLRHPMHLIKGVNRDFECTVDLTEDTVSSVIRVSSRVGDFDSGNSSRDSHALEAVEAMKFPRVTFASRTVRRDSAGYTVAGDLTFHGVTRPVEMRVVPGEAKDRITIKGAFTIKLSDYGVKPPGVLFVKIKDDMTLRFDLAAKP
jgi:polyisoprenoid-binding protein YceI